MVGNGCKPSGIFFWGWISKKVDEKTDNFVGGPIFALFSNRNSIMELQKTPTKPMVSNGSKPSGTFFRGHVSKKLNLRKIIRIHYKIK